MEICQRGFRPADGVAPCPSSACSCALPLQPKGNTSKSNNAAAAKLKLHTTMKVRTFYSFRFFLSVLCRVSVPSPNFSKHHILVFLKPCQLDGAPEQHGGTLISICSTPRGPRGCLATPASREHLANMTRQRERERAPLSTGLRTPSFTPALSEWHCYSEGFYAWCF